MIKYLQLVKYYESSTCLTLDSATYDCLVLSSYHPIGPISQSAHMRYLRPDSVGFENPILSNIYMSGTIQ